MSEPSPAESGGPWGHHILRHAMSADQALRSTIRGGRTLVW
jgi:hypothetical protein